MLPQCGWFEGLFCNSKYDRDHHQYIDIYTTITGEKFACQWEFYNVIVLYMRDAIVDINFKDLLFKFNFWIFDGNFNELTGHYLKPGAHKLSK